MNKKNDTSGSASFDPLVGRDAVTGKFTKLPRCPMNKAKNILNVAIPLLISALLLYSIYQGVCYWGWTEAGLIIGFVLIVGASVVAGMGVFGTLPPLKSFGLFSILMIAAALSGILGKMVCSV